MSCAPLAGIGRERPEGVAECVVEVKDLVKSSRRSLSVLRIWPIEIKLNTISPKSPVCLDAPMVEHALGQAAILLDGVQADRLAELLAA